MRIDKMIKVEGEITLRGFFSIEIPMTEEQFDALSEQEQNDAIDSCIDWSNWIDGTELDSVDVYEVETKEDVE